MIVFYREYLKMISSDIFSVKNSNKRNFDFLDTIIELTPFENVHFLAHFKTSNFPIKIILFFAQYPKRSLLIWYLWKTPIRKSSIFRQIHGLTPFKKCQFFWSFLKLEFFGLKIIVFYPKYQKTIFSDTISVKNSHKKNFDFWTKSMD